MNFGEFIKNPSQFIWDFIDKKRGKKPTVTQNIPNKENTQVLPTNSQLNNYIVDTLIKDFKGFLAAVESKDWKWLFRGKTGIFLKIALPVTFILYLISFAINPNQGPSNTVTPPKQDLGDNLEKPKFVNSNYLNGSFNENKFLVYSKDAGKINEFGLRGILLGTVTTEPSIEFYYPVNKEDFIIYKDNNLVLKYIKRVKEQSYPYKIIETEEEATLLQGLSSVQDIKNLHKTYEGNVVLDYNNKVYVFNSSGGNIYDYVIKNSDSEYSHSYFNGELYFLRKVEPLQQLLDNSSETLATISAIKPNYFLIKLNKNNEEVYSQDLGSTKAQKVTVINDDRYLILFEKPSTDSFFNIQMRDSAKRILYNITPKETDVKITLANNLYFSSQDNTIFVQGNGVAKLFNTKGEQLWVN